MLAKLTSKNQLTLPKSVTSALGPVQYFEVQSKAGQIILTPVRIQRGDALRAKLAELKIDAKTIESAVDWAEAGTQSKTGKPRPAKKSLAKPSSKNPAAKPLATGGGSGRQASAVSTANLKASLTRVFAEAGKR